MKMDEKKMIDALRDILAIADGAAADMTPDQQRDERFCLGAIVGAARRALREAGHKGERK